MTDVTKYGLRHDQLFCWKTTGKLDRKYKTFYPIGGERTEVHYATWDYHQYDDAPFFHELVYLGIGTFLDTERIPERA